MIQRLSLHYERSDKTVKPIRFFLVNMNELSGFAQSTTAFSIGFVGKVECVLASAMLLLLAVIANKRRFFKIAAGSRQILFAIIYAFKNITFLAKLAATGFVTQ